MSGRDRRARDAELFAKIDDVLSGHEKQRSPEPAVFPENGGYFPNSPEWFTEEATTPSIPSLDLPTVSAPRGDIVYPNNDYWSGGFRVIGQVGGDDITYQSDGTIVVSGRSVAIEGLGVRNYWGDFYSVDSAEVPPADTRSLYYGRDGSPLTMEEWARGFEDPEAKIVARTEGLIRRRFWQPRRWILVSTVWLGLDHSFGPGPPLIFETMVFGGRWSEERMWRYATEAEALAGHQNALRWAEGQGTCYWNSAQIATWATT